MKSEIKSGIVLSYVYMAISMLAGLLYTPVMLDLIGQSQYGLYTLATSVIGYLSFLNLGLESAMVKYTAKYIALGDKRSEQTLGGSFLKIYSVLGLVALICGVFVAFNLEQGMTFGFLTTKLTGDEIATLKVLILLMTVNLALGFPFGVYGAAITAHEKFTFRKAVSIIREILMPIIVLIVLFMGHKAVALVVIHVIFNIGVLLSDYIYAHKELHYKPIFDKLDKTIVKEIANYSVFIFIGLIVDRISDATNSMVIGAFSGTAAVAVYGIAVQINHYYLNFSASFGSIFFPRIVSMSVKDADTKQLSDLFIKVGRVQLFVIALICSGFIVFGKDFILLWAGKDYILAYYIIVILMLPALISRSQSLGSQILLAKDKHKFRAVFFLGIALLDIVVSIPLVILWDGLGAAIGTFMGQITGPVIAMNIYYSRVIGLDIKGYFKSTVPILLKVSVVLALGLALNLFWQASNWLILVVQILVYLITYLVTMYFWSFNENEKALVSGVLRKIAKSIFQSNWYPNKKILLESVPDMSCQTQPVFEYMLKQGLNKEYKLIWLVTDKNKYKDIKIKNVKFINFIPKTTLEKIYRTYILLTSRAMLYSNRYIGKVFDKQFLIYLKHGNCIKSRLKHTRSDEINECDACIGISSFFKEVDNKELHIPLDRLIVTGFPRNDYLFEKDSFVEQILPQAAGKKVVLWMPTFRKIDNSDRVDSTFEFPLEIPCLYTVEDCQKLDQVLRENNILLVLKPHPAQRLDSIKNAGLTNFVLLYNETLEKNNVHLYQFIGSTDALITDYSSIYYDYLLTGKPIGITLDDFEVYDKETGFAFENILEIVVGEYINDSEDMLSFVKKVANGEDNKKKLRNKVMKQTHEYFDCCATERVYNYMIENINKRYERGEKKRK